MSIANRADLRSEFINPLYKQESSFPSEAARETRWVIIDAEDIVLGRLSTVIATRLIGKHRADYRPGVLMGDSVAVINASKVKLTGNKLSQKDYKWHSGHIGGLKTRPIQKQLELDPTMVIVHAVKGMLPKTKLGKKIITRLRVFPGAEHNLAAQKPQSITIK